MRRRHGGGETKYIVAYQGSFFYHIRAMKRKGAIIIICVMGVSLLAGATAWSDDGYGLWLKYKKVENQQKLEQYRNIINYSVVKGKSETCKAVREELKQGLGGLLGTELKFETMVTKSGAVLAGTPAYCVIVKKLNFPELSSLGKEGYLIKTAEFEGKKITVIAANEDIGLLYGTFGFLRLLQTGQAIDKLDIVSKPRIQYKLLNHWDKLDGVIERGYGGKSMWKWSEPDSNQDSADSSQGARYVDYARANASLGINGAVLNNVNASAKILTREYLERIAKFADVLRPYGIRVYLSANFSSPVSSSFRLRGNTYRGIGDLNTSDPLNPAVRQWWKDKVKEIYELIPDFGGFLVKANSEGMPGPQDFGRTHADGANMLAEAIEPYHGVVMWRAFVYDQDVDPDRIKRSYMEFVPLDGKFKPNVFVQAKNGPLDFQPREPVQAMFGAMPKTPLLPELQITQEYLGHSTHLVYLAPMWKEYLDFDLYAKGKGSTLASIIDGTLNHYPMTGIAGVANTGNDRNWCGHIFAQANWYAFGRLAWDHELSAEQIADEWIRMTLSNDDKVVAKVKKMMMGSWEACVSYMTPLGLHHIMQADFHYGPGPDYDKAKRDDWNSTYYHRADANGIGFDRTITGSNAVSQYAPPVRDMFNDINTCPEKYLLWFHRVSWNYKMKSGRTLWDELCYKYYSGTNYVDGMIKTWQSLEKDIDPEIYTSVMAKLEQQKVDAGIWRDTCLGYFGGFSKMPISKN
jgi:alpha-glucuronidase